MKKLLSFITFIAILGYSWAAPVWNMPVMRLQPNGDTLRCFVSGDEYYHRLHDANGYTIIQNQANGWYCYANKEWNDDRSDWRLVATTLIPGHHDPAQAKLSPNLIESPQTVAQRHKNWVIQPQYAPVPDKAQPKDGFRRNHGKINNIVIFMRFSDDDEISTPYSAIEGMFNDSTANAVSLHNYFWRVSYGKLRIPTWFYPSPSGDSVISYQDSLPRERFMPYNDSTNPNGYQNDYERRQLEFGLLERAVNYVNQHYSFPEDLNLDYDNDGLVDNICFVLKGSFTGWSDLLWPHKWSLYDREVYLNNKRVYTFNLQLEGSGTHYFSTSTFCHEMFHSLGAPDLYHYNDYSNVSPVGTWDIMCSNTTPPQHMSMYMKMRYGKWIDSVAEITESGTYSLLSVGDSMGEGNCYRIQAGDPSQWYFLEYRDNNEPFEEGLPGSGLLIYHIDNRFNGNSNFDGTSKFDEVRIFHPGGYDDTTSGTLAAAFFSAEAGRTAFTPDTDPRPWLTGGAEDTTIYITDIGTAAESISFTYTPHRPQLPECTSDSCTISITMRDSYGDTWNGAYLTFSTSDGIPIRHLSLGDCLAEQHVQLTLCNEPTAVYYSCGRFPEECSFTINLGDGSEWVNADNWPSGSLGVIEDLCPARIYHVNAYSTDQNMGTTSGSGYFYYGDTAILTAIPNDGFLFDYWTSASGEPLFHENPLVFIVDDDATFYATFKENTSIAEADGSVDVRILDNSIAVYGAAHQQMKIFDAIGRQIVSSIVPSDMALYAMPHKGLYIVHVGQTNKAVIIH